MHITFWLGKQYSLFFSRGVGILLLVWSKIMQMLVLKLWLVPRVSERGLKTAWQWNLVPGSGGGKIRNCGADQCRRKEEAGDEGEGGGEGGTEGS
jgi:hypothetical protein